MALLRGRKAGADVLYPDETWATESQPLGKQSEEGQKNKPVHSLGICSNFRFPLGKKIQFCVKFFRARVYEKKPS